MIPAILAKILPATLAEITSLAPIANTLAAEWRKYPNSLDFINAALRLKSGITRAEAGMMYRVGRYFANQGFYLSKYAPEEIIDRRLAAVHEVPTGEWDSTRPYRYTVQITAKSPGNGGSKVYTLYVPTKNLDKTEEIKASAVLQLISRFESFYRSSTDSDTEQTWMVNAEITNFTRFKPGG